MQKAAADGNRTDFRTEFLYCWNRLPNKAVFFGLLAAWLALFQFLGNSTLGFIPSSSLLKWMYESYNPGPDSDDGHGKLIPFVVLGLFWWKRRQLLALELQTWSASLGLIILGLIFHIGGFALQQPRLSIIGLFIGIYGLMGLAWGKAFLVESFFPFVLFAFCIPLGTLAQPLTFPLRLLVCRIVESISHLVLAIDVVRDGTILRDPTGQYQYDVAAACSGMRSLIATGAVAMIYAMVGFKTWWRRGVLVLAAVPLAMLGNTIRLLTIVVAADIGGQSAGSYVHEGGPLGIISLLPYVAAFGGMFLLGHYLREDKLPKPGGKDKHMLEPEAGLRPASAADRIS